MYDNLAYSVTLFVVGRLRLKFGDRRVEKTPINYYKQNTMQFLMHPANKKQTFPLVTKPYISI